MNSMCCGDFSCDIMKDSSRSKKTKEPGYIGAVVEGADVWIILSCSSDQQSIALLRKRYCSMHCPFSGYGSVRNASKPIESIFINFEYRLSRMPLLIAESWVLKWLAETRYSKTTDILLSVPVERFPLFSRSFISCEKVIEIYLRSNLLICPKSVQISASSIWLANRIASVSSPTFELIIK